MDNILHNIPLALKIPLSLLTIEIVTITNIEFGVKIVCQILITIFTIYKILKTKQSK